MKIGLYFGSFNPIHIGHLIIANHLAEYSDLNQIWLMVTPHNPLKNKKTLLNDYQRLYLANIAIENYDKIKASDFEFKLPQPNYTINTLYLLQEKFPLHKFSLIVGQDNLKSFHKWKNYEVILKNYEIFVYPRVESKSNIMETISNEIKEIDLKNYKNIHVIDAPIVEISSTFIRENIKNKKNIRCLLPEKVWEYIDHNNLYKK